MQINTITRGISRTFGLGSAPGLSVVYVSTYPPRQCGIATFTQDLLSAIHRHPVIDRSLVAAMEPEGESHAYEPRVQWTIDDHDPGAYVRAARAINDSGCDAVSLQFEYGIFGGKNGEFVLRLLDHLNVPVVTTLHTVLPEPDPHRRDLLRAVARRSRKLIVMNSLAIDLLERVYRVPPQQIMVIPHGAPDFSRGGREWAKARLGIEGRKVLSTFGLISRGKGLEYAIRAMKAVAARFPEALYFVLGKTHPGVVRYEGGERYREELMQLVKDLGLEENVRFVDQYFDKPQLIQWLMASDVYVTPYLSPEQIVSGTLAYAMVAGKAIVSTPYLYAQELLSEGTGLLVPFRESEALADAVGRILGDERLKQRLERQTYTRGRKMTWRAVGEAHVRLFSELAEGVSLPVSQTLLPYPAESRALPVGPARAGASIPFAQPTATLRS